MIRDLFTPTHLLILLVLVVVLFGWKKLPDAARSVGRSARIFKSEMGEMKNDGKPSAAAQDTVRGNVTPAPGPQPSPDPTTPAQPAPPMQPTQPVQPSQPTQPGQPGAPTTPEPAPVPQPATEPAPTGHYGATTVGSDAGTPNHTTAR